MFCENLTHNGEMFCSEHMHHESSRIMKTLSAIGTKVDHAVKKFSVAAGILRKSMVQEPLKKFYEYCPSNEGLLPAWLESVDHLIRWLSVSFKVNSHPLRDSRSRFPVDLFLEEFPEIQDIDNTTYYHAFWATYESVRAYGLDPKIPWDKQVPTLLPFLGSMQSFLPYHQAVDAKRYQENGFVWETGVQCHTYAKDLFTFKENEKVPKCPALRLRKDLDGTASPSFEGMENLKPTSMRAAVSNDDVEELRANFRSKFNAPNVGEFNNGKVTPFIEPDPNLERRFQKGLIVIDTTVRHNPNNHRNSNHIQTKFDARNDPAWHFKIKQAFAVASIVSTGDECREVPALDDLQVRNEMGEVLTQEWLDEQLRYLNGQKPIGSFSSTTTMHRMSQNQRGVDTFRENLAQKYDDVVLTNSDEQRDRRKLLDSVDKTMLQVRS